MEIMDGKKYLLYLLLLTALLQAETGLGLNINHEDVEVSGEINMNTFTGYYGTTTFMLGGSYLYAGDNDRENREHLMTLSVSGQNSLQNIEGLSAGLGIKAVFADNYIALPLCMRVAYALPLIDTIPTTSLFAKFAYAPSVLTFSDGETYREYRLGVDMELFPSTHIFAGYRNIDTDYDDESYNFNDSFYGGLKLTF